MATTDATVAVVVTDPPKDDDADEGGDDASGGSEDADPVRDCSTAKDLSNCIPDDANCVSGTCRAGVCLVHDSSCLQARDSCDGASGFEPCIPENSCRAGFCHKELCFQGRELPVGSECGLPLGQTGVCTKQFGSVVQCSLATTPAPVTAAPVTTNDPVGILLGVPVTSCAGRQNMQRCFPGGTCNMGLCFGELCTPMALPRCSAEITNDQACIKGGVCNPIETTLPPTPVTRKAAATNAPGVAATSSSDVVITEAPRPCLPVSEWQCLSKQCIRAQLYCDGFVDCADGSDEFACSDPNADASALVSVDTQASSTVQIMGVLVGVLLAGLVVFVGYRQWRLRKDGPPSGGIMLTSLKAVETSSM